MNRGLIAAPRCRHWTRTRLFSSWPSSIVSLAIIYSAVKLLPPLIDWALIRALWSPHNAAACRDAATGGACWAFVAEKHRFILFGTFPADEHWRPALVIAILLALYGVSAFPSCAGCLSFLALLAGLVLHRPTPCGAVFSASLTSKRSAGRTHADSPAQTFGIALAFPLSILLALGRAFGSAAGALAIHRLYRIDSRRAARFQCCSWPRSCCHYSCRREYPSTSSCAPKLAMILFAAASFAEVYPRRFTGDPPQRRKPPSRSALATGSASVTSLCRKPCASPYHLGQYLHRFFQDTSLVVIIGLFDFLTTIKVSLSEPAGAASDRGLLVRRPGIFRFLVIPMSRYSQALERQNRPWHRLARAAGKLTAPV